MLTMLSQREKISHGDASRLQGAGREEKMRPAVECSGLATRANLVLKEIRPPHGI